LRRNEFGAAIFLLEKVARTPETPSVNHARAVLGHVHYQAGSYELASQWWRMLDAPFRSSRGYEAVLPATVFLAALQAHDDGRFDQAPERLREAGRLGWRARRLGTLLQLFLFCAGQRLYYLAGSRHRLPMDLLDAERLTESAHLLNQAIQAGCKDAG